jgi:hypothetical protein
MHWKPKAQGTKANDPTRVKKFVRTARRYRTVTIQAGNQTLTAAEPPPPDLAEILAKIHREGTH